MLIVENVEYRGEQNRNIKVRTFSAVSERFCDFDCFVQKYQLDISKPKSSISLVGKLKNTDKQK